MLTSKVVSKEEWIAARRALLAREKAHMRAGDVIAAERRALPWVKIETPYMFDTESGPKTLPELFGPCDQLIVHHLMYAPEWDAGCPSCSYQAEHIDGPAQHLEQRGVRIIATSSAPLAKLLAYRARMGWHFPWVSPRGADFNHDFRVTFTADEVAAGRVDYNFGTIATDPRYLSRELPGVSVFYKNEAGEVFHTYSTYARGLDALLGIHHYLDLTPEGRDKRRHPNWPRRHDEYGKPAPSHG